MTDLLHIDRAFVLVSLHEKKKLCIAQTWKLFHGNAQFQQAVIGKHIKERATQGPFGVTLCTVKLSTC